MLIALKNLSSMKIMVSEIGLLGSLLTFSVEFLTRKLRK